MLGYREDVSGVGSQEEVTRTGESVEDHEAISYMMSL